MRISEAEWKIMNVLWRKSPASARDVKKALEDDTDWAYATVKTIMSRLVEKGALQMSRQANTNMYTVAVSRLDARKMAVRSLLNRAFDGAFGPLVHFLLEQQELSDSDREALRRHSDSLADEEDQR